MPKLVNFSLVGSLPLKDIHDKKKEDIKGLSLCHVSVLNWFLFLFSLISFSTVDHLNKPLLLSFNTALYGSRICWGIVVARMLASWHDGACSKNILQLHWPSYQKYTTILLLNLLLSVENEQVDPCQTNYPTKKSSCLTWGSFVSVFQIVFYFAAYISWLIIPHFPISCTLG